MVDGGFCKLLYGFCTASVRIVVPYALHNGSTSLLNGFCQGSRI